MGFYTTHEHGRRLITFGVFSSIIAPMSKLLRFSRTEELARHGRRRKVRRHAWSGKDAAIVLTWGTTILPENGRLYQTRKETRMVCLKLGKILDECIPRYGLCFSSSQWAASHPCRGRTVRPRIVNMEDQVDATKQRRCR